MSRLEFATTVFATLAIVGSAQGQQVTATSLHQPGGDFSHVYAVRGESFGGDLRYGNSHPVVWDSAGMWTSLAPAPGVGAVLGMWGTQQVGWFSSPTLGTNGAMLWEGTPASAVSLHPEGAFISKARAIRGNQQVGYVNFMSPNRAALWTGSAASFVNLHPVWAERSEAFATDGVRQGGFVLTSTLWGAAIWSGTAESYVSLHPPGAFSSSILAMAPGQQAGWVSFGGSRRAAVWNDGVPGWTDFSGGTLSHIAATTGSVQVGFQGGHAAVWFNTPESYLDLHAFLPPEYFESTATSIWQNGNELVIGGYAYRGSTHAFIWRGTIPAPSALPLLAAAGIWAARRRRP